MSVVRRLVVATLVLYAVVLLHPRPARAQSSSQLVPLVTDQTPLTLSNQFGVPGVGVVNDSGDYAFVVNQALFYRKAGWSAPVRVIQTGDELPGLPGSRAILVGTTPRINASGLIVFSVDIVAASGQSLGFIGTFDGTNLQKIVSGEDTAPGTGGSRFERAISLAGFNDAGDIAFIAALVPARPTLFLVPAGSAPVRLTGFGDAAPGTGGTFSSVSSLNVGSTAMNAGADVLFQGTVSGGTSGVGLYVASVGGVRKVVANGDANPLGGIFAFASVVGRINSSGDVAFAAANSIWVNSPVSGTSIAAALGSAAPAPVGGTFGAGGPGTALQSFNDLGHIAFTASVSGSPVSNFAIFRFRPGLSIETVAYRNQVFPGAPAFVNFSAISMNNAGVIAFRAGPATATQSIGIFSQVSGSTIEALALDGQTSPLGGVYSFGTTTATQVLGSGAVYAQADLPGAPAGYGEFLLSPGAATTLMSSGDVLPSGAGVSLRTGWIDAAGEYVGFTAQHPGGRFSVAAHNIATHQTTIMATSGDVAPGSGGGVLSFVPNFAFVNASGQIAFGADVIGGSVGVGAGIFVASPTGGLSKVVIVGDVDTAGRVFSAVSATWPVNPSPINGAGQVVFMGTAGGRVGVFIGSAGTIPVRVAAVTDITSTGQAITGILAPPYINSLGQVAFRATTAAGQGLFVGTAGGVAVKVAQAGEPAPGAGTFVAFSTPSFNNSGELAFLATLSGGGAGIFVASTSAAPIALALNGQAAPAGGTYSIPVTPIRPDAVINDAHDVTFVSDLTGGTAASGYFIRRGAFGTVTSLVLQGDPVPGTGEVFGTFAHTLNTAVGEFNQISESGDVSVLGRYPDGNVVLLGTWRVKADNTVEEILARGTIAPAFGGGTAVLTSQKSAWLSGSRYPVYARLSGGSYLDGIFLFVPAAAVTSTPAGSGVVVTPPDATTGTTPVTLTFDSVTTAGETTVTTSAGAPAIPSAFALGDPPVFYNLTTTAEFSGAIEVCVDFSGTTFPPGSTLRLLHFENDAWQDVTTSGPIDSVICGAVTSLSPFVVVRLANRPPVAVAGADQTVACCGATGVSVTLTGTGSSDPDNDALTYVWRDEDGAVIGNASTVAVMLTPGSHAFTLTVSDPAGLSAATSTHVNVLPASLTVTADNQSRLAGAPNPGFTATYAGFFGGDDPTDLTGTLACTTTAGPASPAGTYPISCGGQTSTRYSINYLAGTLTVVPAGPSLAKVWLGLKNSDDVGTKFDLLVEILRNGVVVSTGQVNSVPGGSSGFNNAVLRTIGAAATSTTGYGAGDSLAVRLSVRIATEVNGHGSGTARLWFGDAAADSRVEAFVNGEIRFFYLRSGFQLNPSTGPGPKSSIDVFVDKLVGGNPFKPFGTWAIVF